MASLPPASKRRGDYGFDAPYVPIAFAAAATVALVLSALNFARGSVSGGVSFLIPMLWFDFAAVSYVYTTRVGKFQVWTELIDGLSLRGDEQLLDVGCGRGAVMLLAAARLPHGRAVGLDLWSRTDQSGNAESVTRTNAQLEGVADRIDLHSGDMRAMPFTDGTFDVVVSSLAIHNVPDAAGRAKAFDEIMRVLKPGGRVVLADFKYTKDYAERLRELGAVEVSQSGLGWRFWYGGPFGATSLVRATKAA